jgi:hypothetical protein
MGVIHNGRGFEIGGDGGSVKEHAVVQRKNKIAADR